MEPVNPSTVTEISVAYRRRKSKQLLPQIVASSDALIHILDGFDQKTIGMQEQFVCMYLNPANQVLGIYRAATGGITSTVADIRIILSVALKLLATGIICAHNHPSGNLKPSRQDEELTRKLKEAGKVLGIKLLDHLIVAPSGTSYFSFADEGLL
jgi:DNA repair protein RadC